MKIFTPENSFEYKINFIDENEVLLGYDYDSQCCENFGWFISDKIEENLINLEIEPDNIQEFVFDTTFFETGDLDLKDTYDEGRCVIFKLVNKEGYELFLHLFNIQNGYYSHGFKMDIKGTILQAGNI